VIVRYQADADLNQAIVTGVLRREPTIDFQTAFAAGLKGVKDPEVLAIAVIIISRKLPIEVVIEELLLIWAASSAEEWVNRIAKLPL
jgi:hypothetical protein